MQLLKDLRRMRPLVLNITNQVTTEFIANGLLAIGASPVMSQSVEEIDELVGIADAVVINIGTLHPSFIDLALRAAHVANANGKVLVIDPVGAGATRIRTQAAKTIISKSRVSVVRGNASEIMALAGGNATTKGVDTRFTTSDALSAAVDLASATGAVVVASGQRDLVVDSEGYDFIDGGCETMTRVVGTGCLLTAVVAAFHAVHSDSRTSAIAACSLFKSCGEKAGHLASGSFKTAFLDELFMAEQNAN